MSSTTDDGLTKDIQASIDDLENKQKQHAQQQAEAQAQAQQQQQQRQNTTDQDGDHQMIDVDINVGDADDSTNLVSQTAIDNELSKLGVDEATAAAEEAVKAAEAEAAAVVEAQLKLLNGSKGDHIHDHETHQNDNQERNQQQQPPDNDGNANANTDEEHKTDSQLPEFKVLQSSEHTSSSSLSQPQNTQQQSHQEESTPLNEIFKGREFFVITKNKSGDTIYLNIEQLGGRLVNYFTDGCIALAKGSSSLTSDIDYDVYSYSLIYAAEREKCVPDFEKYRLRRANKLPANLDIDFGDYTASAADVGVEGVTAEDGSGAVAEERKENGAPAHQGIDAVIEHVGKHVSEESQEHTTTDKVDDQLKQTETGTSSKVEFESSTSDEIQWTRNKILKINL
ncbi:unnamed protein product [Ambrosiozyma monospora]|uniref:Unnamed protein product n=1 Tax=Ambrosiozyma monospora TaxID=43982 RepID=A0ACB5TE39_AMBMO|nr:unnamed protein product [Ambrosiozyma monospora]